MPTLGINGSTITWSIDDDYLSNLHDYSVVNEDKIDVQVTLIATITYNYVSVDKVFKDITITGKSSNIVNQYYASINATSGDALKQQLRTVTTQTHTKNTTYADCKEYLQNADADPNNSKNMILFYTGESVEKTADMTVWNREHVWCQSLGWFTESGAGSDLHHIRPCDPSVNSSRGNKTFGESSKYYEPIDEYKGDIARIIFYLMVRYAESDNYNFADIAESLTMLLEWNRLDPVSEQEINRNEYIQSIQGNRNPFIDNSLYAEAIWG